jgi:hypothetical protein
MPAQYTHNKDSTKPSTKRSTTVETTLETTVDNSDRTRSTLQRTVGIPTTTVDDSDRIIVENIVETTVEKRDRRVEHSRETRENTVEKREKILWDYFS